MTLPASSSLVERVAAAQARINGWSLKDNLPLAHAAIAVVVEECAKVCDGSSRDIHPQEFRDGVAAGAERCANDIRRLAPTPKDDA